MEIGGAEKDGPSALDQGLSLSEYVFRSLREAVQSGKLVPGSRLRERELAQSLGVSRTPVREALLRMTDRGLAETVPGRGLILSPVTASKILHLYDLRAVLEGAAARFAAENRSKAEIELLKMRAVQCRDAGTPLLATQANSSFHHLIYDMSRNEYLIRTLTDLDDYVALLRGPTRGQPMRSEGVYEDHVAIIGAIEKQDPDLAETVAKQHINNAKSVRLNEIIS